MQDIRMKQNINLSINDSFYYTLLLTLLDYCIGFRFQVNYLMRTIRHSHQTKLYNLSITDSFYCNLLRYCSKS